MFRSVYRILVAAALACSLLLSGCNSGKITKDNFAKIKPGMTQKDVEAILGEGKVATAGGSVGGLSLQVKSETWTDGNKQILVQYDNSDKVVTTVSQNL
jgi:hypothetical protein